MAEDVNKAFLKSRFGTSKGLLLKPEGARDMPYLGDRWEAYPSVYEAETEGSDALRHRLMDFLRLLHTSDDETFRLQIAMYMDVDEFLRFLAVNTLLSNLDSFLYTGQNFYLYLHPKTLKITWIPWDLNEAFAGFIPAGSVDAQMDLSIDHPHVGENQLIDRILAIDDYRRAYHSHLNKLLASSFTEEKLHAAIDATQQLIGEAMAEEEKTIVAQPRQPNAAPDRPIVQKPPLKLFLSKRIQSVTAQLAGQSRGQILHAQPPG